MTSISRGFRIGVAGLAAALALAGCGDKHPGAAAFVGKTRISTTDLTERVTRSLADPQAKTKLGTDRAGFERRTLSQLIDHDIIAVAAKDKGVSVTEGDVDTRFGQYATQAGGRKALEQQAAQNGIAPQDLRGFVRDLVLTDALGDKLVADVPVPDAALQSAYNANRDQYDQVHSAHVLVKDKATADRILAAVKASPDSFADQAKRFSIDPGSKDKGGDLPFTGRGGFVKPFSDAAFGAKPGSFVEVKTEFGWHVIHVLERRTTTLAQAAPDLRRQVLRDQRNQRVQQLLTETAKRLDIRVSPRFGTWNAKTGQVDPPKDTLSSPVPSGGPSSGGDPSPGGGDQQQSPPATGGG